MNGFSSSSLTFDDFWPAEFEEFAYDLLEHFKFVNLSWRKGSGLPGPSVRPRLLLLQPYAGVPRSVPTIKPF